MLNFISQISRNRYYWLGMLILCLGLEATALFYQYRLDYRPCVVCIHVRLWLIPIIFISLLGWLMQTWKVSVLLHILVALIMGALIERSYVLLSTERGWAFGSCDFDLGLPAWFTIEEWFPVMFKVWEPCGYTPELLFGITMAEALMAMSVMLTVTSAALAFFAFRSRNQLVL